MGNFVGIFIGGWTDGDDWTATHANWVQDSITKTINAADGSAHAPTSAIEIAAAGLVLTDVVSFDPDGASAVWADGSDVEAGTSHWHFGTAVQIVGATNTIALSTGGTFDMAAGSVAQLGGDVVIEGNAFTVTAPTAFDAGSNPQILSGVNLDITNGATLNVKSGAALTAAASSAVVLAGANTISGATAVSGAVTRTSKETRSGSGARTALRINDLSPNGNRTLSCAYDHYFYEQSSGTSYTLTLDTLAVPPSDGEVISLTVTNTSGATSLITVKSQGSSEWIIALNRSFTLEAIYSASAGHWRLKNFSIARIDATDLWGQDA